MKRFAKVVLLLLLQYLKENVEELTVSVSKKKNAKGSARASPRNKSSLFNLAYDFFLYLRNADFTVFGEQVCQEQGNEIKR